MVNEFFLLSAIPLVFGFEVGVGEVDYGLEIAGGKSYFPA